MDALPALAIIKISHALLEGECLGDLPDSIETYIHLRQTCKTFYHILPDIKKIPHDPFLKTLSFRRKSEILYDKCMWYLSLCPCPDVMLDIDVSSKESESPYCVSLYILSYEEGYAFVYLFGFRFKIVGPHELIHSLLLIFLKISIVKNSRQAAPYYRELVKYLVDYGQYEYCPGSRYVFVPDWANRTVKYYRSIWDTEEVSLREIYKRIVDFVETEFCSKDHHLETKISPHPPYARYEADNGDYVTESWSVGEDQERFFEELEVDEILKWTLNQRNEGLDAPGSAESEAN